MSGLADALTAPPKAESRCVVGQLLIALSGEPDDRRALEAALEADSGWSHAEIARTLQANGHGIGDHSIGNHRRRGCGCSR